MNAQRLAAALLALLAPSTTASAFNQPTDLRGITTVHISVSDLPGELAAGGMQKEALAAHLEEALKSGGLTVLPGAPTDTVPTISLRVSAARAPGGRIYAVDVALACLDNVTSLRVAGPMSAVTWSRDVLSLLGAVDQARVAASESSLVDLFLSDWLLANQ